MKLTMGRKHLLFCMLIMILFTGAGLLYAAGQSSPNYIIESDVISAGGGSGGSTNYFIEHTTGQSSVIGDSSSSNYSNFAGFWNKVPIAICSMSFSDVSGHWSFSYIEAIFCAGITTGFPDGTYKPENQVTRAQMAAFIIRALYGESFTYSGTPHFPDCSPGDWEFKYVQKLFEEGITTGFPDGTYGPDSVVTRAQMAAFLIRALYGESFSYSSSAYFPDVPAGHWAFKYVQRLFEDGITTGFPDGTYGPDSVVTRAQMAAFLARAFLGMP